MSSSVVYHCPKCGKDHHLSQGVYRRSAATAEEVLSGEYGTHAKAIFEKHPGKSAFFSDDVFYCNCGHASSKKIMRIFDDDLDPWDRSPERKAVWHNAEYKCSKCGRDMRLIDHLPSRIRCECGSWTEFYECSCLSD